MATSCINITSLIKTTIRLVRENEDWTTEQILSEVMKKVPVQDVSELVRPDLEGGKSKTSKTKKASDVEKKPRAAAKPRAVPEDDTRCCARSFYEKEHLDGGILKVMRDDPANLYGDRCKFKKSGETDFCKHHADKQTLGIWDGEYSGKFKIYVEKTESESEEKPAPKATKSISAKKAESTPEEPSTPAPSKKSIDIPMMEEDEEVDEEAVRKELAAQMKKKAEEKKAAAKKPEPEPEPESAKDEEGLSVEEFEIEGTTYLIDEDGNVYDCDTQDQVGIYNKTKGKWIQRM